MKIEKATAIPLITCDPFFSIWSPHDKLNDGDTAHWSGKKQTLRGYITIDGCVYTFLGFSDLNPKLNQTSLEVTATRTKVMFEHEKLQLTVTFTTPLILEEPELAARPLTYIDFSVEKKVPADVAIYVRAECDVVKNDEDDIVGGINTIKDITYATMGKANQAPLSQSGDNITINWGWLYLATRTGTVSYDKKYQNLTAKFNMKDQTSATLMIAYDDLVSINYFGDFTRGLWVKKDGTILGAIVNADAEYERIMKLCDDLDDKIYKEAINASGEDFAFLCNMSYRQTISAHKIIEDKHGNLVFLSKENDSNGCIGTADVSYPSIPLFLLFGTEYVKGMILPIMEFASCDGWEYDFAPHDVGRYPYAWGQVYGVKTDTDKMDIEVDDFASKLKKSIYPAYYMFPSNSDIYDFEKQMPVEECGNMLIMIANVCKLEQSGSFAKPFMKTLKQWVTYLVDFGADPENQLCTDDFAGHLAHNVNLAFKAVIGIEAYALVCKLLDDRDAYEEYHRIAKDMAEDCVSRAMAKDHLKLTFDNPDSFGMKYNMIWDKIWGSHLFGDEVFALETDYYLDKINEFGLPLDNRMDYTKSDWALWCAAMAQTKEKRNKIIAPVAKFLKESPSRYPFGDWYETVSGSYCHFKGRSVQGGIFMPLLYDRFTKE